MDDWLLLLRSTLDSTDSPRFLALCFQGQASLGSLSGEDTFGSLLQAFPHLDAQHQRVIISALEEQLAPNSLPALSSEQLANLGYAAVVLGCTHIGERLVHWVKQDPQRLPVSLQGRVVLMQVAGDLHIADPTFWDLMARHPDNGPAVSAAVGSVLPWNPALALHLLSQVRAEDVTDTGLWALAYMLRMDQRKWSRETRDAATALYKSLTFSRPVAEVLHSHFQDGRLELLQHFQGVVLSVQDTSFQATLKDLTQPENPSETATFSKTALSAEDLPFLQPGARFDWRLGYQLSATGQRTRCSRLQFNTHPFWSPGDLQRVQEVAESWHDMFEEGSDG